MGFFEFWESHRDSYESQITTETGKRRKINPPELIAECNGGRSRRAREFMLDIIDFDDLSTRTPKLLG
jgi:hypothetical protein